MAFIAAANTGRVLAACRGDISAVYGYRSVRFVLVAAYARLSAAGSRDDLTHIAVFSLSKYLKAAVARDIYTHACGQSLSVAEYKPYISCDLQPVGKVLIFIQHIPPSVLTCTVGHIFIRFYPGIIRHAFWAAVTVDIIDRRTVFAASAFGTAIGKRLKRHHAYADHQSQHHYRYSLHHSFHYIPHQFFSLCLYLTLELYHTNIIMGISSIPVVFIFLPNFDYIILSNGLLKRLLCLIF